MKQNQNSLPDKIERCLLDLGGLVRQTSGLMFRLERELFRQFGVTATQAFLLSRLSQTSVGVSMGELSQELNLDPSTVTRVAAVLERAGLIRRERSAVDSRMVLALLTEAGARAAKSLEEKQAEFLNGLLSNLPRGHVREVMGACETFNGALAQLLKK